MIDLTQYSFLARQTYIGSDICLCYWASYIVRPYWLMWSPRMIKYTHVFRFTVSPSQVGSYPSNAFDISIFNGDILQAKKEVAFLLGVNLLLVGQTSGVGYPVTVNRAAGAASLALFMWLSIHSPFVLNLLVYWSDKLESTIESLFYNSLKILCII